MFSNVRYTISGGWYETVRGTLYYLINKCVLWLLHASSPFINVPQYRNNIHLSSYCFLINWKSSHTFVSQQTRGEVVGDSTRDTARNRSDEAKKEDASTPAARTKHCSVSYAASSSWLVRVDVGRCGYSVRCTVTEIKECVVLTAQTMSLRVTKWCIFVVCLDKNKTMFFPHLVIFCLISVFVFYIVEKYSYCYGTTCPRGLRAP